MIANDQKASSALYQTLTAHAQQAKELLTARHPEAVTFLQKQGIHPGNLREHATKLLTSGALATTLLLMTPAVKHVSSASSDKLATISLFQRETFFRDALKNHLPSGIFPLTPQQEADISSLIAEYWGIDARATLQGERLNHSYGLIGAEQHLPRFPGDTVHQHDELQEKGITPATGAWSYFANDKSSLTEDMIQKEKYYVAVQTLYLPDWNERTRYLKEWYKYRKVVVINPANGKVIVCDIADAGPAKFTGKHFGGSPEVMAYLGLNVGMQKGPVVLFFVEDPEQKISLGPLQGHKAVHKVIAAR